MAAPSNILQNKWLTDVIAYLQSGLQIVLFVVILICGGIAWWRYQSAVFVIAQPKADTSRMSEQASAVFNRDSQPIGFYTDLVEKRDIFRFSTADSSAAAVIPDVASSVNQDMMSRYIVQGIVYDQNPLAIIKDIQSNKTYFLHRSEMIEGATLVEIRDNRVIFDRNGETLELIKK